MANLGKKYYINIFPLLQDAYKYFVNTRIAITLNLEE